MKTNEFQNFFFREREGTEAVRETQKNRENTVTYVNTVSKKWIIEELPLLRISCMYVSVVYIKCFVCILMSRYSN